MSPPTGGFGARRFQRPEDDPPGTSRLFIAVPVADDVRRAVGQLMEDVAGAPVDVRTYGQPRWVRVEGLHLTLRFLGATPDGRQAELADAIRSTAAGTSAFRVTLAGGGAFPNPDGPRVLWVGIDEGREQLAALTARLSGELAGLGWPPEGRPFQPHLTIARTDGVPGAGDRAARLIEVAASFRESWQAERLVLYRSLLGRGPARYEAVADAALIAP
jgi:2'-5' RNA ligase